VPESVYDAANTAVSLPAPASTKAVIVPVQPGEVESGCPRW
jgi:hypothetical protein